MLNNHHDPTTSTTTTTTGQAIEGVQGMVGFADLADPTDLTDPTAASVRAAAALLASRLRVRRPQQASECRDPAAMAAAIGRALAGLDQLTGQQRIDQTVLGIADRVADDLEAAQHLAVNRLSFILGGDLLAAWALVRTAYAVHQGRCTAGQRDPRPCSPHPDRVRMNVHDGNSWHGLDQSCVTHAAHEWATWDHRVVEVVIIGPRTAADAVRQLGARLQRDADHAPATGAGTDTTEARSGGAW
jgi:hypothetical protein